MKKRNILLLMVVLVLMFPTASLLAQDLDVVELLYYAEQSGEADVMRDLLDRFEEENPDIAVDLEVVDYESGILDELPMRLEAGEGPDIARVTDLVGLAPYYLDLRPYLSDPEYWEENFGNSLWLMRPVGDTQGIYGYPLHVEITIPFVNRSLFDEIGVPVPSDASGEVTWYEWAELANAAAGKSGAFAMAMDRSGHTFAGPAISMGAQFFDRQSRPAIDDEGFRTMVELFVEWHQNGSMPFVVWAGSADYADAAALFVEGQVAFYITSSGRSGELASAIGDAFDWQVVPNPCGPGACTGMPGEGTLDDPALSALVAFEGAASPEAVARVMEYLASTDVVHEFAARTLLIPAHVGVASSGVAYEIAAFPVKERFDIITSQVARLDPVAFKLLAYPYNQVIFDSIEERLGQAIIGELTIDEAIARIQEDIDYAIPEAAAR